jgi:hypothetical protein
VDGDGQISSAIHANREEGGSQNGTGHQPWFLRKLGDQYRHINGGEDDRGTEHEWEEIVSAP